VHVPDNCLLTAPTRTCTIDIVSLVSDLLNLAEQLECKYVKMLECWGLAWQWTQQHVFIIWLWCVKLPESV